jgi:hypothetical protein
VIFVQSWCQSCTKKIASTTRTKITPNVMSLPLLNPSFAIVMLTDNFLAPVDACSRR